jgi:hypothetical protein
LSGIFFFQQQRFFVSSLTPSKTFRKFGLRPFLNNLSEPFFPAARQEIPAGMTKKSWQEFLSQDFVLLTGRIFFLGRI